VDKTKQYFKKAKLRGKYFYKGLLNTRSSFVFSLLPNGAKGGWGKLN